MLKYFLLDNLLGKMCFFEVALFYQRAFLSPQYAVAKCPLFSEEQVRHERKFYVLP